MLTLDEVTLRDKIVESCPSFEANGKQYYVVERDLPIEESKLLAYAKSKLEDKTPEDIEDAGPIELVVATLNGTPVRWELGSRLTWLLDRDSFPNRSTADQAQKFTEQACAEWNQVAEEQELDICFREADSGQSPVFAVQYENFPQAGLYAVAFFPHDPASDRVVRVGPPMFQRSSTFDPVGVMRHELGHVLGFRHEHIRTGAPGNREPVIIQLVTGDELGGLNLTPADIRSVMHYPFGPDFGTNEFELTDFDRDGMRELYTMPAGGVREFAP